MTVMCQEVSKKVRLTLYVMRVEKLLERWPEQDTREQFVVSRAKLEKLIRCCGIGQGMRQLGES